jgi:hypothetical protein
MGAFFGCCIVALAIVSSVGYGIEPALLRIADALEGKELDDPENPGYDPENDTARPSL